MPKSEDQTLFNPTSSLDAEIENIFDVAVADQKLKRHRNIDLLLDQAVGVVGEVLDSDINSAGKMFAVKLAVDIYTNKEKFEREDERLRLEKEKLEIDRKKLSVPGGPLYIYNQLFINENKEKPEKKSTKSNPKKLLDRKHEQARLLEQVSGVPQIVSVEEIDEVPSED